MTLHHYIFFAVSPPHAKPIPNHALESSSQAIDFHNSAASPAAVNIFEFSCQDRYTATFLRRYAAGIILISSSSSFCRHDISSEPGLKLESVKGPVETLTIDEAPKPTAN